MEPDPEVSFSSVLSSARHRPLDPFLDMPPMEDFDLTPSDPEGPPASALVLPVFGLLGPAAPASALGVAAPPSELAAPASALGMAALPSGMDATPRRLPASPGEPTRPATGQPM